MSGHPLDNATPLIGSLLSHPIGDRYPALDITPQRQKELTLQALVDQLSGLAERQPVLFVFEDAHWIDPTTLEVLELTSADADTMLPGLPLDDGVKAEIAEALARGLVARVLSGYDDTFPVTAPVESMVANGLGLFHLGGNVAEWLHDVYGIHPSNQQEVAPDPAGPTSGELHVIRGASWMDSTISELRLSYRDYGSKARPDVGFRIARTAGDTP